MNEDHIQAIEQIGPVNKKLNDIFKGNAFELKNDRIKEFGFEESVVKALVYSPFESQIDTGMMMSSLADYSSSLGIRIINGCDVEMINEKEDHVKLITNSYSGRERIFFNAKKVIVCTNAFSEKFFPDLKIKPGRGQVLVTKPVAGLKFKGVFHFDEGFYYFRNYGDRVIFGGGRNLDFDNEETSEFALNEIIINDLKDKLKKIILPGNHFETDYCWTGIMGFNDHKQPEIKNISDRITFAMSCNGMGIALSSYISKEIAGEINL